VGARGDVLWREAELTDELVLGKVWIRFNVPMLDRDDTDDERCGERCGER